MENASPGLVDLAAAIRARLDALGLSTVEVGNRGGPQRTALRYILNAARTPRASTLSSLDTVLQWPPGTAQGILDGLHGAPEAHDCDRDTEQDRLGVVRARLVHQRAEHLRMAEAHTQYANDLNELVDLIDQHRAHAGS